ncbi:hypothetical protein CRYUN_Cryun14cG0105600 [Craigia yunnanensis]
MGVKQVTVGVVAVFDGHNGAEASETASKLLLEYFALHTYFLLDATFSIVLKKQSGRLPNVGERDVVFQVLNWDEELGGHELNFERFKFSVPENLEDSFHLDILKEALLREIHDIDATFSKEASKNNLGSGSTATVILIADATLLQLYKEQRRNGVVSPLRNSNFKLAASSGLGGVPRVNGQLAISCAIGDVLYKRVACHLLPGNALEFFSRQLRSRDPLKLGVACHLLPGNALEFFSRQLRSRDPLKLGFQNVRALWLVRDLLLWDPDDRSSVDDALRHPYFHSHKS